MARLLIARRGEILRRRHIRSAGVTGRHAIGASEHTVKCCKTVEAAAIGDLRDRQSRERQQQPPRFLDPHGGERAGKRHITEPGPERGAHLRHGGRKPPARRHGKPGDMCDIAGGIDEPAGVIGGLAEHDLVVHGDLQHLIVKIRLVSRYRIIGQVGIVDGDIAAADGVNLIPAGMQKPRTLDLQADAEAVAGNAGNIGFGAVHPVRGSAHLGYDGAGDGVRLKRTPEAVAEIPRKLDRHAKQAFAAHFAPLVEAKHEAERMVRIIDCQRQRRLWQESFDFLPDRGAIRRQEELVGGVDGFAPYIEDAGSVAALGGTKCDHASPLASAEFSRHGPAGSFP
ncbi:hypothetical protein L1887_57659 [Cichorium endivia]|nr:hypothetical protein L1887_57659 [Cichorium endivia]